MTVWTGLKDEWKLNIIENCENKQTNKKNEEKRRVAQSEERWKKGLVLLEYKCDAIKQAVFHRRPAKFPIYLHQ